MTVTLDQLLTPMTEAEATDLALSVAASLGFPVTAWQPGNPGLTLCRLIGRVTADLSQAIPKVAAGGLRTLAGAGWLDLVAENQFDEIRAPSVFAQHTVALTTIASAGPYTVQAGQLWLQTASGLLFTNLASITLSPGSTVDATFQAESPGAAWNVGLGTITRMLTPLPGVTVVNTELTQSGTDAEADDSLRVKLGQKWSTITPQPPVDAYELWAKKASPQVVQAVVDDDNPYGPYTLRVLLSGASGAVGPGVVADVVAMLATKKSRTARVTVESVVSHVVTISGTIAVKGTMTKTAARALVESTIDLWLRDLPAGGEREEGDASGSVQLDSTIARIGTALGDAIASLSIELVGGTPDVALAANEKAVAAYAITYLSSAP